MSGLSRLALEIALADLRLQDILLPSQERRIWNAFCPAQRDAYRTLVSVAVGQYITRECS